MNSSPSRFAKIITLLAAGVLALVAVTPGIFALAPALRPLAPSEQPTQFRVRVENISGGSALPSPLAPGVWAVHDDDAATLFEADAPDRGDGLEALAEDGNPANLAAALAGQAGVGSSGVFNTPAGAPSPAPIFPGDAYEFTLYATPAQGQLSLATMLVQSNDLFYAPGQFGIDLFDANGDPISGEVTNLFSLWDAGSELNEAPGAGPNQAPRQSGPDTGPQEGVVSQFSNSTRALPLAKGIAAVSVAEAGGTYTFTLENVSAASGSITTPIAPVFYATHDGAWKLFDSGQPDFGDGLESLAEDGSPAQLVGSHTGAPGTGMVGAQVTTLERPGDPPGPAFPGEHYQFSVTPDAAHPYLTIAAMVVESNDVFLAFDSMGVSLLDDEGAARPAAAVESDIMRMLATWDAGTEANEVPGVGPHQPPRQAAANTGPADAVNNVRRYADATNDLAGPNLGGFASVDIAHGDTPGSFVVTLANTSDGGAYPGLLTPVVWATHDDSVALFETGMPASPALERLAEDGNHEPLLDALNADAGVGSAGVANQPDGGAPGPLMPGSVYTFTVTPDSDSPYLSIASMVVPSNDTFLAFGSMGVELLDESGARRSEVDIAADVAEYLAAWDAGTEHNQAGAAGPDQAPRQSAPDTGADEGNGYVRVVDDAVWQYPHTGNVIRVTVYPVYRTWFPISLFNSVKPPAPTNFTIRVENISGGSALPSPLAPGVWAVHDDDAATLFEADAPDRGDGLEALAEDGNPANLAAALAGQAGVGSSGVFNTPAGAPSPAPIFPGDAYEFTLYATPAQGQLSLATMLVQSNDLFYAPGQFGIDLFDANGDPISGEVTNLFSLWDAGSELNEAPGAGPNQAPRQSGPDTGPQEGVVSQFSNSTRALPLAKGIAAVSVAEAGGTYTFTLENVSAASGSITTPIAPVFYATHDGAWKLFDSGQPDFGDGLESLAEDGSPAQLVGSHTGAPGTGMVGAQVTTLERPGDPPGPAFPGEHYQFSVTPDAAHPYLTIAAMVVESNDVFLAFDSMGVSLLDDEGAARPAAAVESDIMRMLATWDAGTEANEVPGVGPHQPPRQAAANTGPADADNNVRRYADATNDLAGPNLGGFASVDIAHGDTPGSFVVTLANTSDGGAYPGLLTPVVWATHDDSVALFETGMPASPALERLAEDGNHEPLLDALNADAGVGSAGVANQPDGGAPGPLMPGSVYTFTVTPDSDSPYLSIASMVVPSNDTFLAFDSMGVELLDESGARRSEVDIAADVAEYLAAWDAGTEHNQAGAAGPDQAPRQSAPDTGADEGNGYVRVVDDVVWQYPHTGNVIRVTVTPN